VRERVEVVRGLVEPGRLLRPSPPPAASVGCPGGAGEREVAAVQAAGCGLVIAPCRRVSPRWNRVSRRSRAHQLAGALRSCSRAPLGVARACRPRRGRPAAWPAPAAKILRSQPGAVPHGPGAGGVLAAHVVAQQQLRESLPGAHQIARRSSRARNQVTQRFFLHARHPHRTHRVDHQQPQHPLGGALVDLDLVLRRALDLPRRRNGAPDPRRLQRPRQPAPGRARPIRHSRRPGQPTRNSTTLAVSPDSLAERSSPDSASSVTASTLRACTSRPAQLRTFAMIGAPSIWLMWATAEAVILDASHSPPVTAGSVGPASTAGRPFLHMD
jgi:hypothetical protein